MSSTNPLDILPADPGSENSDQENPNQGNPVEESEHEISQASPEMELGEPDLGQINQNPVYPNLPPEGISTRRQVVRVLVHEKKSVDQYVNDIEVQYNTTFSAEHRTIVQKSAISLTQRYKKLMKDNSYKEERLKEYLDGYFTVSFLKTKKTTVQSQHPAPTSTQQVGAPTKEFDDLSDRQKQRRLEEVVDKIKKCKIPSEVAVVGLVKASAIPQRAELIKVIKHCLMTPGRPKKALEKIQMEPVRTLSPEAAYGLMLSTGISVRGYNSFKLAADDQDAHVFPSYRSILNIKSTLRPPPSSIEINEIRAKVNLQALLDLTCQRILKMQEDVLKEISNISTDDLTFIISWGFDGSTGQSNYKQQYTTSNHGPKSDSALFATTMIPLQMLQKSTRHVLWQNPIPQSVRFCRPIELEFVKESKDVVKKKHQDMLSEISNLVPYTTSVGESVFNIQYDLLLTIIDGKVLNIITDTASVNCPICGATPSMFNVLSNLSSGKFQPKPTSLKHGINPMHAFIRMLELFLHIGYKVHVKKWRVYDPNKKKEIEQRKLQIQGDLFEALGLRVDFPNPGGAGSSNDGNTARRAFKDYEKFAGILGIDKDLLWRIKIILSVISCNIPIDPNLFDAYCKLTAELYVAKYSWYPMSPSLHKILIHGADIVRNSLLPLGMLSEQAAESKNKYYRADRLQHARKTSRTATMADMFNRSIDFSDPVLSTQALSRAQVSAHRLPLEKEAIELLICQDPPLSVTRGAVRAILQENIPEEVPEEDVEDLDDNDDVFLCQLPDEEII